MTSLSRLRERAFHPAWNSEFHWAAAFFVALGLIGLFSFRSFGVPYDEGTLTQLGMESYAYVFEGAEYPSDPHFRFHGTAVELPLTVIQKFFSVREASTIAYMRRLSVFCFFFLAVAAFYALAKRMFHDWRIALLGAVFFVLSPRVFAHGFYNSRDIPAMAMFTVAGLTLMRLLERPTVRRSIIHGIVCGFAIGIRMPALFLLPLTALFLGLEFLGDKHSWKTKLRQLGVPGVTVLLAAMLTTYCVWPLLWAHPIRHFLDAYAFMSTIGSEIVFLGKTYASVPVIYIPGWIAFTTPLLYTILFLIGCVSIVLRIARARRDLLSPELHGVFLPLLWFFLPIVLLVVGKSGIYQEWRHVLFLYPAFLLIALHGIVLLHSFARSRLAQKIAIGVIAVPLLSTMFWMWRNHPHETVYYAVPRTWISDTLDLDYWGLSSKQALEWLDAHDQKRLLSFNANQNIVLLNGLVFFAPHSQFRMVPLTNPDMADYLISVRDPVEPDPFASLPELYSVVVDGMKLISIHEGNAKGRAFMDDMRAHPEKFAAMMGM